MHVAPKITFGFRSRLADHLLKFTDHRCSESLLLSGRQSSSNPSKQNRQLRPTCRGLERQLALQQLPCFLATPVINGESVTGS